MEIQTRVNADAFCEGPPEGRLAEDDSAIVNIGRLTIYLNVEDLCDWHKLFSRLIEEAKPNAK